jgi:hypothetical protein
MTVVASADNARASMITESTRPHRREDSVISAE